MKKLLYIQLIILIIIFSYSTFAQNQDLLYYLEIDEQNWNSFQILIENMYFKILLKKVLLLLTS